LFELILSIAISTPITLPPLTKASPKLDMKRNSTLDELETQLCPCTVTEISTTAAAMK
jgi:hypothetical protein